MEYIKYLSLITQLGLSVAVPIIAGVWLGGKLDEYLDAKGIVMLICLLLGIGTGFMSAYKLIMGVLKHKE